MMSFLERMESCVIAGEGYYLNTWLLLLLSWLAFLKFNVLWSDRLWNRIQCPRLVSIQANYPPNPFPTVLAVSHMFMHDTLTSFSQMLPVITINRSLQVEWGFKIRWSGFLFKYEVSLESLWGRWLGRVGSPRSWVLVLFGYQRFNEMILPPASSVSQSPCCHVCVVRI